MTIYALKALEMDNTISELGIFATYEAAMKGYAYFKGFYEAYQIDRLELNEHGRYVSVYAIDPEVEEALQTL